MALFFPKNRLFQVEKKCGLGLKWSSTDSFLCNNENNKIFMFLYKIQAQMPSKIEENDL